MLIIRDPQMAALKRLPRRQFETKIIGHLSQFYKREYKDLGPEQMRLVVRHGIERAEQYGFRSLREITYYASLMFFLGSDFDRDPQLPWAAALLADCPEDNPSQCIVRLWEQAMAYMDEIVGEKNEYLIRALLRIRNAGLELVPQSFGDSFVNDLNDILNRLYPQKWCHQGKATSAAMIRNSFELAEHYGLRAHKGVYVFVVLMFMLGSGFHNDPFFPWAIRILNDQSLERRAKTAELYATSMGYLDMALREPKPI